MKARLLAVAVLLSLWTTGAGAGDGAPRRFIDLDKAGALEALQQSNFTHYEKVRQILEGAARQPEANVSHWMLTTFSAQDVIYAPIVLTSFPAKRHLSFVLDDTRYDAVITLASTVKEGMMR